MLKKYFADLFQTAQAGDAREESFYGDLTNLLETYADQNDHQDIHVTTLPKRTEVGNPDFRTLDEGKRLSLNTKRAEKIYKRT